MTRERERLIEIMNDEINASEFRVTSDVLGRSADAILAEMAGEWNAGLDVAKLDNLLGRLDRWLESRHVRDCPEFVDSRSLDHAIGQAADTIRALRRPDAAPEPKRECCMQGLAGVGMQCSDCPLKEEAPARPAMLSVEEVAHALFMADTGRSNSLRLAADGYYRKLAIAILPLFAKERS